MRISILTAILVASPLFAQHQAILAIGAHAADVENMCGATLAHQRKLGDRVVILHMTLGEAGNPKLSPEQYAVQKRKEAMAAAKDLGAEVIFGPYRDAMLPNDAGARLYVADVIRQVKPTVIITHWKNSTHKDHKNTHDITVDALLMAGLEGVKTAHPPYSGVRSVYYAENWEDADNFQPYVYVDVTDCVEDRKKALKEYQLMRGGVAPFPYFDYYTSLVRVRGALAGFQYAEAFDVDTSAKKVTVNSLR
jgi:LmbE family N-acetylglucosaminyl deacetylase